ncbi:hypothetical protein JST97_09415 [bacterium]|nr:hypothetical protein [bacterium]
MLKYLLCLALTVSAFADGRLTWCDSFKVKDKDSPTDVVSYALGAGTPHSGNTYQLNSINGNRLLFWIDFNPPLSLDRSDGIHVSWVQQKEDGSEVELQNQRIGGSMDSKSLAFAFIPYAVPGRYWMRIIRASNGSHLATPLEITITQ